MSAPRRYLDGDRDTLCARLLASAEHDAPSSRSLQRALATAAAIGAATATAGTATATATATAAASSAVTETVWLKWLAIGALAGGITAGTLSTVLDRAPEPKPAPAPAHPVVVVAPSAHPIAPPPVALGAPVAPEPSASVAPAPLAPSPAVAPSAEPEPEPEPEPAKDTLRDELARIDAARKRQAGGDARGAIAELDRYQKDFPAGRFFAEAALIRAEALAFQGNCNAVRRMADEAGDGGVLARRWAALRQRCP